jgi:hypothetical protein
MTFELGRVFMTPGVSHLAKGRGLDLMALIGRHASGDFGDIDAEDKRLNMRALKDGSRIMSSYDTPLGVVWVITDSVCDVDAPPYYRKNHRPATTALLPSEY